MQFNLLSSACQQTLRKKEENFILLLPAPLTVACSTVSELEEGAIAPIQNSYEFVKF